MKFIQLALASLALSLTSIAAAQGLRNQLVGTWDFVVAEVKAPDGKKSFPFGETPKGILIFMPDGRFAQIHVAGDLPKIASNNRLTGTPEEYADIMRRSISVFGTIRWTRRRGRSRITSFPLLSPTGRARRRRARSTSSRPTSS